MNPFKQLIPASIILSIVSIIGTSGYMLIEKWSFLDSIYMVIITMFTIGFQETHQLSGPGRLLTIFIIIGGVGTAVFAAGLLVEIIVEGEILGYRRKKKMDKKIREMKDHYIICGLGRTGRQVAKEFDALKIPYVVIDRKPETAAEFEEKKVPHILGDIISDKNLEKAGIKAAKGLITTADSDVANVYVSLSARELNPSLYIIARASERDTEKKLRSAGANRVISPYYISGKRMAAWAVKPITTDFLEKVIHGATLEDSSLGEILVPDNSPLIGQTLHEAQIRQKTGALVLAIRKEDKSFIVQPEASSIIEKGDVFIAIGSQEQLSPLESLLKKNI